MTNFQAVLHMIPEMIDLLLMPMMIYLRYQQIFQPALSSNFISSNSLKHQSFNSVLSTHIKKSWPQLTKEHVADNVQLKSQFFSVKKPRNFSPFWLFVNIRIQSHRSIPAFSDSFSPLSSRSNFLGSLMLSKSLQAISWSIKLSPNNFDGTQSGPEIFGIRWEDILWEYSTENIYWASNSGKLLIVRQCSA